VIVNSKLIAINRNFLSILNVPSFIYFFHHFIFILMPLSTWKSGLACFMQMFYFIENQHCQTNVLLKCTFQVNKDSIVQLKHGLIFSFFQVGWEHSSQAPYFRNNEP